MYLQKNGFSVAEFNTNKMESIKERNQVPEDLRGCHTAIIEGYVIEGHVPVAEINRLLAERPDILGIGVAGMPPGSPGMDSPGVDAPPFDVVAFDKNGRAYIFASYP